MLYCTKCKTVCADSLRTCPNCNRSRGLRPIKGEDEVFFMKVREVEAAELEELFDISFEDVEFETLNGFMIYRLDRIPEPNEEFDVDYQGYNFKILSVQNKMIQSVLVTKLPEETVEEETEKEKQESKK